VNPVTASGVGSSAIPREEAAKIAIAAIDISNLDFDSRRSISELTILTSN
jgi:hypothetical protein